MKRLSLVVISLLIFLFQTVAQEQVHDHSNTNNKIIDEPDHSGRPIPLKNGFFKVYEAGKWKILDKNYKAISNTLYDGVGDYSFSVLPVNISNKWGLLNENGSLILKNRFDIITDFNANVTGAKIDKKWFLINTRGEILKELNIDFFGGYSNSRAKVYKDNKYALMDLQGNILSPGWMANNITSAQTLIAQRNNSPSSNSCFKISYNYRQWESVV